MAPPPTSVNTAAVKAPLLPPLHGVAPSLSSQNITNAMRQRYSARAFVDKPVPLEVIEEILSIACRAPSGGNTQPWHVYVVVGEARDALVAKGLQAARQLSSFEREYHVYPPKDRQPPAWLERRQKCASDMYTLMGVDPTDRAARTLAMAKNFNFFGAPVGMVITVDRCGDRNSWGHTGMFLQSIMLLAHERGLATCPQEAWGNMGETVYEALSIPKSEVVWCGLAIGYAETDNPVNTPFTQREPLSKVVQFRGFPDAMTVQKRSRL
eukprot:TRINITY_DN46459_c0_g1_i1.p1 TRINITY_DN46459_c0_g1~~TRINITY_DN46459_c0_g1_i1.p1  ORF type:complete len:267 (+),score=31.07 TRINITY_DN46459_c0_g1_i1:63-863(+)